MCGFIVPPNSNDLWKVRLHGASTIHRENPWSVKETRAATMKSGCIKISSATDTLMDHERTTIIVYISRKGLALSTYQGKGRYDDGSDHSLSSLSSARELVLPKAGAAFPFLTLHQRAFISCPAVFPLLYHLIHVIAMLSHVHTTFVHLTCSKSNEIR